MGKAKEENVEKIGLLGYSHGEQSLFLDAESGGAIFGKGSQGGQLAFDPNTFKSLLYSKNYWEQYNAKGFPKSYDDTNKKGQGMIIDLTTPEIVFGNGKSKITKDGFLEYEGNLTSKGIFTQLKYIAGWNYPGNGMGVAIADLYSEFANISTTRDYYGGRPIGLSYGTVGFMPCAATIVQPDSNGPELPSTIQYFRKTLCVPITLPQDFEIKRVTVRCQYRKYQEEEFSSLAMDPNKVTIDEQWLNDLLVPLVQNMSLYTNPSYFVPYSSNENGETVQRARTIGTLTEVGIYVGEDLSRRRFYSNTESMVPQTLYNDGLAFFPDYAIFDNVDLDSKLIHISDINCSNAELNTTHFIDLDITNSFTSLETGKTYYLVFAPNESMPQVSINDYYKYDTASQYDVSYGRYKSRNKNVKELVYGAISKSVYFYAEIVIEGYIKTNAFN